MHVDEFIDKPVHNTPETKHIRYAQWFLMWKRMAAYMQRNFAEFYGDAKLFCDYKNKKYRVTGASRMGDIWLRKDLNEDSGYDLRVDIADCSKWCDK